MRSRASILCLVVMAALALGECRQTRMCQVCQRAECGNMAFAIRLEDGRTVETCCPRCGLRYLEGKTVAVRSIAVKDFDRGETLDARSAVYVEGSDVTPCSSMHEGTPPVDERGCCMKAVYDRCLPSVLAFRSRERAESFAKEHGGTVKTLAEIDAPAAVSRHG